MCIFREQNLVLGGEIVRRADAHASRGPVPGSGPGTRAVDLCARVLTARHDPLSGPGIAVDDLQAAIADLVSIELVQT